MGTGRTDEFRKDAVRIALTSGLSRQQVAHGSILNDSFCCCRVNSHWQSTASGQVVRLMDGMGVMTYERVRLANDPTLVLAGFGLSALLALSTLIGLIWRQGLKEGSRAGTLAAGLAVVAAVSVWALVAAVGLAVLVATQLGMEFMFDQPQPTLTAVLVLADVLAVFAALVLLSLVLVWRAGGWSLWRRLHHTGFALVLAATGALFVHWGLAFGGMG